jgi:hypothetical protein
MALIRNCRRLWKSWSQIPAGQLHDNVEFGDDMEFTDTLQALDDRIVQIAEDTAALGDRRNIWFLLGEQIADGGWEFPQDRAWVASVLKRQPKKRPVIHRYEDARWTWSGSDEVQEFMRAVAARRADLVPSIEDNATSRRLLPYDRIDYWPWFKIEAGLQAMLVSAQQAQHPQANEAAAQITPSGGNAGEQPLALRGRPRWDIDHRELWVGETRIRKYSHLAKNQTAVLAAFEEEDWPYVIDSPITADLGATLRDINNGLTPPLIKFRGVGTGKRISWEYNATAERTLGTS